MVDTKIPELITAEWLRDHRDHIFVFGDNMKRIGKGGAAALRGEINTYGFITKKYPNNEDTSFFSLEEYLPIYETEIETLKEILSANPEVTYIISRVGAGLANKYGIWEKIIEPKMEEDLIEFTNVVFLW